MTSCPFSENGMPIKGWPKSLLHGGACSICSAILGVFYLLCCSKYSRGSLPEDMPLGEGPLTNRQDRPVSYSGGFLSGQTDHSPQSDEVWRLSRRGCTIRRAGRETA